MRRTTRTAPKAPPLYARIRQIPDLHTKFLVVSKGHALRDEFSEVAMIADAAGRKSKTALVKEGKRIGYAVRSESWRPGYGSPGAMGERAHHG